MMEQHSNSFWFMAKILRGMQWTARMIAAPIYLPGRWVERHIHLTAMQKKIIHIGMGLVVAAGGVVISKQHWLAERTYLHLLPDYVGYFLHGVGLTPLAKVVLQTVGEEA